MMMQSFVKFAWSFLKGLVWALLFLVVVLVAAGSFIGFTAYGNQFAANRIADFVSTPDLTVSLRGARGLLQGHFRIDSVVLADTKGEFARIDGLKLDWTPTALLKQRFHAEHISADKVAFSRAPVTTIESPSSEGTFSMPVEVAVDKIDLPLVALGKALIGKDTELALAGTAKAVTDQISLDIKASEKSRPEASATAKLAYGVNARTLNLDGRIAEPQGGLLARALALPGMPPVEITVQGDGPLDAWQGAMTGKVDGTDVLHLTGRHNRSQAGLHELIVNGGGQISELLPPNLRSLFTGETKVDISTEFDEAGLVEIRAGSIVNDSLVVTASGKLDPTGDAALKATVLPTNDTIRLSLPLASGALDAALRSADVTLSGPFRQARLNLDAVVDHVTTPDAGVEAVTLKASSPAFNLQSRSGPLLVTLTAEKTSFKSAQAAKLVQGPLKIDAAMDVSPELIKIAKIAIESPQFGATIAGEFRPLTENVTADLKLFVRPGALLPPDLAAKAEGTIALSGKIAATLPDKADVTDLKIASNLVTTEGTASYDAGALTANLRGALADLSLFEPKASGKVEFAVDVSGQATSPKVAALVSSAELTAAGQTLTDLDVKFDGLLDPSRPGGKISAAATLLGQKLDANADIVSQNGRVSFPTFVVKAGANTLSGAVALDQTFKPSGKIDLDLPDLGSLASIAGQQAAGALKGRIELASSSGITSGKLALAGSKLRTGGVEVANPTIDVDIADLTGKQIGGVLRASSIASGTNKLDDIAVKFALAGNQTSYDLSSQFDGAPLTSTGFVEQVDGALAVTVQSFAAAPRKIPVELVTPTRIVVRDGAAVIDSLLMSAGDGTIAVSGSTGKTLNLKAKIEALPASLANIFAKDLGAEGTLSAEVDVTGTGTAPVVAFDARLNGASTLQTRARGLENLDVIAKGKLVNNVVNADLSTTLKDQPTHATVEVNLAGGKVDISAIKLAVGETTLAGNVALDASGKPSGKFSFDIPDAAKLAALAGQKAEGALKGTVDFASVDSKIKARIVSTGSLRGQPIVINLDAVSENGAVSLPALKVDIGRNTVSGAVNLNTQFMPTGSVTFDLPDLALLAALAGQKAEGSLKGKADITSAESTMTTNVDATGAIRGQAIAVQIQAIKDNKGEISLPALKLDVGKNTLSGALNLDAAFMPSGTVTFDLPDIALLAAMAGQKAEGAIEGMAEIKSADGKITGTIKANGPRLVSNGTEIVKPVIDLQIADLSTGQISGSVTSDKIASGANQLVNLALDFQRNGPETAFTLKSQYDGAPLLANGAIVQQPGGALSLKLASFSAAPKKIPVKLDAPVEIKIANGDIAFNNISITAGRGKISVTGSAGKALNIKARITALPASLANTFSSGLDASGTISANVTVSGPSSAPAIAFDGNVQNASIAQTKAAGLAPLAISAKGNLAKNVLSIDTSVRNADGLSLTAKGTVGLTGATPLAINVNGQLPFSAAGAQLAAQGIALNGDARFNMEIRGTAAKPAISGSINSAGGTLTLIRQNLVIKNLAANVTLSGDQARIVNVSGALDGGGTVSATGTVGFAPGSGLPADLKINLKNAVYVDGNIVAAKVTGDLAVNGKLQNSPALTGTIRVNRADITIPEKLPGALSKIRVIHKNAPADVQAQSTEIKAKTKGTRTKTGAGGLTLDLTISARRQIFVRGRGLDTELGGEVKVTGTSSDPNAAGGFKMVRGRLAIIGKRLDFTTGQITFGGGMMPYLNMVASSAAGATTVYVNVNGPANGPTFSFTSSPALPQDEVLAQLIFGRSSSSLSAVQIAQLADAVATLAGGQSSSLFNKLRQGLGVDDLDIGSDENGKTNVTAGKYLNKRTYLELQQGDTSKAIINLDIGKGVKLKGEAGADGSTATGLFYEKEY